MPETEAPIIVAPLTLAEALEAIGHLTETVRDLADRLRAAEHAATISDR